VELVYGFRFFCAETVMKKQGGIAMIIVLKPDCTREQIQEFTDSLQGMYPVKVNAWFGTQSTVLGLIGDTSVVDIDYVAAQGIVESVKRVQEPYKKANRKFHPDNTVVTLPGGQKIGDGSVALIAGPCSVENEEQICAVAERVKQAGAQFLRGGAFKPRTSPYAFQGLKAEGLHLLREARKKTGLPIVTEIMRVSHIDLFEDVDIIQVGARNMQNFELLKELGKLRKPILLKRGLSSTIEELLMSAEYIMAGGNEQVILCERGIRTYETFTRNTLDISAVPILKKLSHLPVVVDPSHASGISWLVEPLALAAVAAGADGLIIEVHNDPSRALSDGPQSLTPDQFDKVASHVFAAAKAFGRKVG
jgi:3-deoxy-7-phosphoheptulonate synthase